MNCPSNCKPLCNLLDRACSKLESKNCSDSEILYDHQNNHLSNSSEIECKCSFSWRCLLVRFQWICLTIPCIVLLDLHLDATPLIDSAPYPVKGTLASCNHTLELTFCTLPVIGDRPTAAGVVPSLARQTGACAIHPSRFAVIDHYLGRCEVRTPAQTLCGGDGWLVPRTVVTCRKGRFPHQCPVAVRITCFVPCSLEARD